MQSLPAVGPAATEQSGLILVRLQVGWAASLAMSRLLDLGEAEQLVEGSMPDPLDPQEGALVERPVEGQHPALLAVEQGRQEPFAPIVTGKPT